MSWRWPLHPPPYPGEALSSWVNRIARALDVPSAILLHEPGISRKETARYHLDFNPPEPVLHYLAERTGQAYREVRRLTARGYVPSLLDTLDETPHGMAEYTHSLALLLPVGHRPDRHRHVLPWYSFRRFHQPRGCRDCLAEAAEPYLRLHWRFAWVLSCPLHRRMLEALRIHAPINGPIQVTWPREEVHTCIAPQLLLTMDAMTLQAITGSACRLLGGTVPAAFWIRLLRTVLDELGVGTVHAGSHHPAIRGVWNSVGLGYSHYLREWRPYECLRQRYQELFMRLAAQVFNAVFEQPAMRERIQAMAQSYSAGRFTSNPGAYSPLSVNQF